MPDVHTLDLEYLGVPRTIASYLVVGRDGPVLIETGPGSTYERLQAALREHGYSPGDLKAAFVTHIHLDHAGAAGLLAREGVTIYVHEFGAPHLANPERLINSARRIYGDQMDRLWGEIIPVPEQQVVAVRDGDVFTIDDVQLTAIETPGHARHHHAFRMDTSRGAVCFTGDAAAMIVPGCNFITLPTPPPEFDLEAWLDSAARLEDQRFRTLYLTHFGAMRTPVMHLVAVRRMLRAHAEFVRSSVRNGMSEAEILERYRPWVQRQAIAAGVNEDELPHFLSENLLRMNVTGMVRYWTKQHQPEGAA